MSLGDFFDNIKDFIEIEKEEFKNFSDGMKDIGEDFRGAFVEFAVDVGNLTKDFERDVAYDIDPNLGEFVEEKQKVESTIDNVINSPKNLTLIGKKCNGRFQLADHLFVRRGVYTHHAIYIGDGMVIHFSPICDSDYIMIHSADLEEFADGEEIYRLGRDKSPLIYKPEEAVRRAWSRVGEDGYNLFGNNCEQFVRWCRSGREDQ